MEREKGPAVGDERGVQDAVFTGFYHGLLGIQKEPEWALKGRSLFGTAYETGVVKRKKWVATSFFN